MRVLFICSGNKQDGISPIILNQGYSLIKKDVKLDYFLIKGKGYKGYLKNVLQLKKFLQSKKFDIIHAHYSLSGFVAAISGAKPLVVSLMGSDIKAKGIYRAAIHLFSKFIWLKTIVKSTRMKEDIDIPDALVIPNGVDMNVFTLLEKNECQRRVSFNPLKKHIVFIADKNRKEKNFLLAQSAFKLLNPRDTELHIISNTKKELIPIYLNASDILLLTSLWEGSPNVIKEALACNLPIISTNVGDVSDLITGIEGCFICTYDEENVAEKIDQALHFCYEKGRIKGRQMIIESGLDADSIAEKIQSVYNGMLLNKLR